MSNSKRIKLQPSLDLLVIIPAYNEVQVIDQTLTSLFKELAQIKYTYQVAVIDDGSKDQTSHIARQHNVILLRHLINRGLGGALNTGIELAKQLQPKVTVTFDADGQHDPKDIARIIKPVLTQNYDFVVGSRLLGQNGMGWDRKLLNHAANQLTYLLFGYQTTDSQSGLRAFSQTAIQKLNLKTQRMEVSSEFFQQARIHRFKYTEINIKPIYTDYSLAKGQEGIGNLNSLNILGKLIMRLIR